ncbi:MAG TPA: hypothetical protein VEL06_07610 [Haliangiales bacterium]|nr:hypothetical protein [Haliangiales bacterium]
MDAFHIEHQGKSAKVSLRSLPAEEEELNVTEKTSVGQVTALKVTTGVNAALDPASLKPDTLIGSDPELDFAAAGQILEPESLSTAYYDPGDSSRTPVSNFRQLDLVFDAQGQEKERRQHLTRKANICDIYPVKIGKRIPISQALTQFVFRQSCQIVHEDGVTRDFLFAIASELHEKQEMAVLGAGPKGNLPLVVRDKGSPYRGFLYGEIGAGADKDKYKLLVLLSDQELKRPAMASPTPA